MSTVRKAGVLVLGWLLVLVGIAALVLPGPGLLLLFAGLAVLATEYDWAKSRLDPVKVRALRAAEEGVRTNFRIAVSVLSALGLLAIGLFWGLDPRIPDIGPIGPQLPFGGWGPGSTLILSGLLALVLVIGSVYRFRRTSESNTPRSRADA